MTSTTTTGTWVRVTDGEAALWRHQQRRPLSATYNIYAAVEIEGRVNVTVLRSAVEAVLTDHFRLTATIADDERGLAWRRRGLCWRAAAIGALDESGAVAAEARRPFLPDEPLHRIVYWDAGLAGGLLQLTVHHVACDGLRLHLLVGQIVAVYRRLVDGAEEPVGSPALPYEPLVTASEADRFWRPRRALADQTFALAPARVLTCAPEVGERLVRVTETSVADCASRAAEVHAAGVSPFAVVAAGVAAALAQWSAERTFAVRIPFSHRRPEEDWDVSYRVRLLPVLAAVAPAATAGDLIGAVGEELSQAALHSIGARTPSRVRSDRRPPRGRSSW